MDRILLKNETNSVCPRVVSHNLKEKSFAADSKCD